jgi:hypothetical protein
MHHILHLRNGIHAAAAYHQVGIIIVNYLAVYTIPGKLGEIDVVALRVGEPIGINSARARIRMRWPTVGSKGKYLKIRSSTCRICIGS